VSFQTDVGEYKIEVLGAVFCSVFFALESASIMRKEFIMAAPIDDKRRPCAPVGQVDT
jgi:hypothetical protein